MTKAETFMIVDAHRQDPMQRVTCELLSAIFTRSGSIETIGTADHSVNWERDLLFLTDSSRFIHRMIQNRLSVNDPGEVLQVFARILKKLMSKDALLLKRSNKDPVRSLRFIHQPDNSYPQRVTVALRRQRCLFFTQNHVKKNGI